MTYDKDERQIIRKLNFYLPYSISEDFCEFLSHLLC
jgi:hypothetical protein